MTVSDFFRSEPVSVEIKVGLLGAVIYLAVRYFGGCHDLQSSLACAGVVVLARRIPVGLCSLAYCRAAAGSARVLGMVQAFSWRKCWVVGASVFGARLVDWVRSLRDLPDCAYHGLGRSHIAGAKIGRTICRFVMEPATRR